jgi:hypothetical protein
MPPTAQQTSSYYASLEVEDVLAEFQTFTWMFDETRTSTQDMYAYGTVVNYDRLEAGIRSVSMKYNRETWLGMIEHWKYQSYLSPIAMLVARWVERMIESGRIPMMP